MVIILLYNWFAFVKIAKPISLYFLCKRTLYFCCVRLIYSYGCCVFSLD
jgi:hypothetical protein